MAMRNPSMKLEALVSFYISSKLDTQLSYAQTERGAWMPLGLPFDFKGYRSFKMATNYSPLKCYGSSVNQRTMYMT